MVGRLQIIQAADHQVEELTAMVVTQIADLRHHLPGLVACHLLRAEDIIQVLPEVIAITQDLLAEPIHLEQADRVLHLEVIHLLEVLPAAPEVIHLHAAQVEAVGVAATPHLEVLLLPDPLEEDPVDLLALVEVVVLPPDLVEAVIKRSTLEV